MHRFAEMTQITNTHSSNYVDSVHIFFVVCVCVLFLPHNSLPYSSVFRSVCYNFDVILMSKKLLALEFDWARHCFTRSKVIKAGRFSTQNIVRNYAKCGRIMMIVTSARIFRYLCQNLSHYLIWLRNLNPKLLYKNPMKMWNLSDLIKINCVQITFD